ncbi:MAG: DUF1616 domain-containing protein [Promethearchaeota archaeon]
MNLKQATRKMRKALDDHFILILIVSALLIVSGMLAIHFITYKPQRFSSLGLLDQDGNISEFPDSVEYNETLTLRFSILNHQGIPELYQVRLIYGDAGTIIDPVAGSIGGDERARWQKLASNGDVWEKQITLSFNSSDVGMNKIIFELWMYSAGTSAFVFTNISVHLWIDVVF